MTKPGKASTVSTVSAGSGGSVPAGIKSKLGVAGGGVVKEKKSAFKRAAFDAAVKGDIAANSLAAAAAAPAELDPFEIQRRIKATRKQLQETERQIFNLETQYFETTNPLVNALRGYEGLLSGATTAATGVNKKAGFKPEERIFSTSSVTGRDHLASALEAGAGS